MERIYKIGNKIEVDELETVSKIIMKKALKVIASNGDIIAHEMLEGKHRDTVEDIKQEIILQLILNDYIITKECYKIVRKTIYQKTRETIELVIDKTENENENEFYKIEDKKAYINFLNNEYNETTKSKMVNVAELLEGFTDRQKEIITIYANGNSRNKTAELLGISKGTVNNTIKRLRDKIEAKQYEIA